MNIGDPLELRINSLNIVWSVAEGLENPLGATGPAGGTSMVYSLLSLSPSSVKPLGRFARLVEVDSSPERFLPEVGACVGAFVT